MDSSAAEKWIAEGVALRRAGEFDQAERAFEQAGTIAASIGRVDLEAEALLWTSIVVKLAGGVDEPSIRRALALQLRGLELATRAHGESHRRVASARHLAGVTLAQLGRNDESVLMLLESSRLYSQLEAAAAEHEDALFQLSMVLEQLGEHALAIAASRRHVEVCDMIGDELNQTLAYARLARLLIEQGNATEARPLVIEARRLAEPRIATTGAPRLAAELRELAVATGIDGSEGER